MSIIGSHSIYSIYDLMGDCNLCAWLEVMSLKSSSHGGLEGELGGQP